MNLQISSTVEIIEAPWMRIWYVFNNLHIAKSINTPFPSVDFPVLITKSKLEFEVELVCYEGLLHDPDISGCPFHPAEALLPSAELWELSH